MTVIQFKTRNEFKKISELGEDEKKAIHILSNVITGNLKEQCKKLGISRNTLYKWRKNTKKYYYITSIIIEYAKDNLKNE